MIALAISVGTATPLAVVDTGTTGYVLVAYNNGQTEADNSVATSRWVDGGALTSSRRSVVSMSATIRVCGTSAADLMSRIATFGSAVGQFGYTVTESYSGGSAVHMCLPATWNVDYDPVLMRANMAILSASIPRQP